MKDNYYYLQTNFCLLSFSEKILNAPLKIVYYTLESA